MRGREIKGRTNGFVDGGSGTHSLRSSSWGEFICLIFPGLASPYVSTPEQESLTTSDLKPDFSSSFQAVSGPAWHQLCPLCRHLQLAGWHSSSRFALPFFIL
jgi:hypothetical protein